MACTQPSILTVALLPVYRNPYQHLLTAALARHDVQVLHLKTMPSAAWLRREQGRVQVLHLHWLYGLYMNRYRTPLTWPRFLARFALARRLGYRIVWTAHNILPHRMLFPPHPPDSTAAGHGPGRRGNCPL